MNAVAAGLLPLVYSSPTVKSRYQTAAQPSRYIVSAQDTTYPTTGGKKGAYRLLIQRPDSTGVFSGDFNTNSSASVASLQPSFTGQYTNLEVVDVNATNSTGSASLTPAQLCAYLKAQNPGGQLYGSEVAEPN